MELSDHIERQESILFSKSIWQTEIIFFFWTNLELQKKNALSFFIGLFMFYHQDVLIVYIVYLHSV